MGNIQTCFKKTPKKMSDTNNNAQNAPPAINVSEPKQQSTTTKLEPVKKTVIAEGMQRVGKHGKSHHEYLQVMNQHKADDKYRPISLEELAQHKTRESAWCSLNGVVYDVTVYLDYHPGGDILLQGCGKQCAPLFNKYHPWVNGKYLLAKYQIGFLK